MGYQARGYRTGTWGYRQNMGGKNLLMYSTVPEGWYSTRTSTLRVRTLV